MSDGKLDRRFGLDAAPFVRGSDSYESAVSVTIAALTPVLVVSSALFGFGGLGTLLGGVAGAVVGEKLAGRILRRADPTGSRHAALMGLLTACTLPAGVPWHVAILAGLMAAAVGKVLVGGLGHYPWHPAIVGRVFVEWALPEVGTVVGADDKRFYPILAVKHALWGDLSTAVNAGTAGGWLRTDVGTAEALLRRNPLDQLRELADGVDLVGPSGMAAALRDHLPPIEDCLIGAVGGGMGATPTLAIVLGGLFLVYRGIVTWQLPVSILLAFCAAIAVLPIHKAGSAQLDWFPGLIGEAGAPIPYGILYVCYHLSAGPLMLVAFFIAGDWIASPMTIRGRIVYGIVIGVSAAALRLYGVPPYDCWALLLANTIVPVIDRLTARRVMGT